MISGVAFIALLPFLIGVLVTLTAIVGVSAFFGTVLWMNSKKRGDRSL